MHHLSKGLLLVQTVLLLACGPDLTISDEFQKADFLKGRTENLNSPFVTAGDRLYTVGHQDGSFPDLGWHIEGEMGGIWMHPIKLMDGFEVSITDESNSYLLNNAEEFRNYPFGNAHTFNIPDLKIERKQFAPDGLPSLVINFYIENISADSKEFELSFVPKFDLRPTWLGDSTGMVNSEDQIMIENDILWAKDIQNDWFAGVKTTSSNNIDKDKTAVKVSLEKGERRELQFYVAGSMESFEDLAKVLKETEKRSITLLKSKKARLEKLASFSTLKSPDSLLNTTFQWLKYNTDWLVNEVPGIGRGITAGIPDYPWWFGVDSEYALKGVLATGNKELVYETIELIAKLSKETNGNGRIIHEASSNGFVFNKGNINETPQFVSLIKYVFDWTGDKDFLRKYYPLCKSGMEWLYQQNDSDQNLLPEGFGMMEIHGLNSEMIDVASYSWKALVDLSSLAQVSGEVDFAEECLAKADQLKQTINDAYWVEDFQSYADFIGDKHQALELIHGAKERATDLNKPWAVRELEETEQKVSQMKDVKQGHVLYHNWVVNTPMEVGLAPREKALAALKTAEQFTNPYGMFVTGIDRDEADAANTGSAQKKIFSYVGAVMTLPTGVQAIAENNYGRPDKALDYLQRMTKSFGYALPGSMYEVSPDFGMMTQAWNIFAFAVPIVNQFFGINPKAADKMIILDPVFPESWPQASLESVKVNELVFDIHINGFKKVIDISSESNDWTFQLSPSKKEAYQLRVNDKIVD
ncbi:glycogen debranching protein [Jiulongibacter sp. NS-SX5]|uniref:glycogen debranching protein n=1 Tax=Jiulongibacter sp. NS-SX5 TaxID=3463854 RepID=UPI004059210A